MTSRRHMTNCPRTCRTNFWKDGRYRGRWRPRPELFDQRYDDLQKKLNAIETPGTRTLMIQGGSDFCDEPAESEGMEHFFTAGYRRIVLDGVGHFPPREASEAVAHAVLAHFR